MTKLLLSLGAVVVVACALSLSPVQAQSPVGDALATLAAATANAQMIRQQQEAQLSAQRATVMAVMVEQTRTAAQVNATATSISVQSTQSALDELNRQRSMTATAQHGAIMATGTALVQSARSTATVEAMNEQATRETYRATATSQAVMLSAQATDTAQLSQTYATRQERYTWGLLAVEIFFVIGAAVVLWRLALTLSAWAIKMRPKAEQPIAEVMQPGSVVIEQEKDAPRMPDFVQVVDSPQMVEALDRWAERYDAEHGEVTNGNQ